MKQQLKELGYKKWTVDEMLPETAHQIIKNKIQAKKEKRPSPNDIADSDIPIILGDSCTIPVEQIQILSPAPNAEIIQNVEKSKANTQTIQPLPKENIQQTQLAFVNKETMKQ